MAVDAQRHAGATVPENLLHDVDALAAAEHERGRRVSQLVKRHLRQAGSLQQAGEVPVAHSASVDGSSHRRGEYKVGALPHRARAQALRALTSPLSAKG